MHYYCYNANRAKSDQRHILTIPIIYVGLYTSCSIRVDVGTSAIYTASLLPAARPQPLKLCHPRVSIININ